MEMSNKIRASIKATLMGKPMEQVSIRAKKKDMMRANLKDTSMENLRATKWVKETGSATVRILAMEGAMQVVTQMASILGEAQASTLAIARVML